MEVIIMSVAVQMTQTEAEALWRELDRLLYLVEPAKRLEFITNAPNLEAFREALQSAAQR